ncbi:MAG: heme-binding protein [Planctomycetes bacterium]|nr:heme-binding protein [Planctomycetota bacterium]
MLPIAGDWDGDGVDTVGLYDSASGTFTLADDNTSGTSAGTFQFGPVGPNVLPVAGDWNGDGTDTVGVYDPTTGTFHLAAGNIAGAADNTFLVAPALDTTQTAIGPLGGLTPLGLPQLLASEVEALLRRAAAASASEDAIIVVVDRGGHILGVRAEADVLAAIPDTATLVFAIDGAVAKARTAAFFSNGDPINGTRTPLTSRTIRFISQSTITQREVESNPNSAVATIRGPGLVAPIGLGGHFPPEIDFTPPVDLFAIEHSNRDSIVSPGPDHVRDTITLAADGSVTSVSGDDILLTSRFNADPAFIPAGQEIDAPESYGFVSGRLPNAQSRGIATLPGGIPLFRDTDANGEGDTLIGGIGVFFPGTDGYATHEQGFVPGIGQTEKERTNAPRVLEAEWIAFAAAGGSVNAGAPVGAIGTEPALAGFDVPVARLDLVGIQLEGVGPHPTTENTTMGVMQIIQIGAMLGTGSATSGADQPINVPGTLFHADGEAVPEGWLVLPHASGVDPIGAADVTAIINDARAEAELVRAAIRIPMSNRTQMVMAVTDTTGEVLGLFRMTDATFFSLDVAVAKARNTAYYADAGAIVDADRVDADLNGIPDANVPAGTAFTNRTFRFLAEARLPDGIDGLPGPFSILNDPGTDPLTAENTGAPVAASAHTSVLGFDAFNPNSNFRDPDNVAHQNGVVFFPGSTPIYKGGSLVGGFGVSGDGVDQDDVVTFFGAGAFLPPDAVLRADEVFVRTVRLPFMKFLRNPEG